MSKPKNWKPNEPRVDLNIGPEEVKMIEDAVAYATTHYLDKESVAAGEKPPLAQTVVLPDGFTCIFAYQWCPDKYINGHARTLEIANDANGKINHIHPSQSRVLLGLFGFRCDDDEKSMEHPAMSKAIPVVYGEKTGQGSLFIQRLNQDEALKLRKRKKPAPAAVS